MTILYEPSDYSTVFTVEELGQMLHISSLRVIHGWLRDGTLRGKKIGRQWLVTRAEFKRFVAPEEDDEQEE